MTSVAEVSASLQEILTGVADKMGRESGFIQRRRKLSGASFVQTLVFGWLASPTASLSELSQAAATCGVVISGQGLAERFSAAGAACLRGVLEASIEQLISGEGETMGLLRRFNGVYIQDSTIIGLPVALRDVWAGCGNQNQASAGLKIQTVFEYGTGRLQLSLHAARQSDQCLQTTQLPTGSLRLADTGYFSVTRFQALQARGVHWLSRVPAKVCIVDDIRSWSLLDWLLEHAPDGMVDTSVQLTHQRFACRLLAYRVPPEVAAQRRAHLQLAFARRNRPPSPMAFALCEWTILATDLPATALTLPEALIFLRCRWQIELLFKLWKSYLHLAHSRSAHPWRILCEVYAKLIAVLVQHWLLLLGASETLDRSWFKALPTIQKHAFHLATVLYDTLRLRLALTAISAAIARCRATKRRTNPSTFQRLEALLSP